MLKFTLLQAPGLGHGGWVTWWSCELGACHSFGSIEHEGLRYSEKTGRGSRHQSRLGLVLETGQGSLCTLSVFSTFELHIPSLLD